MAGTGDPSVSVALHLDHRGVVVERSDRAEPRRLPWDHVLSWRVDEWAPTFGTPGAQVTYFTPRAAYRFAVPWARVDELRQLVQRVSTTYAAPEADRRAAAQEAGLVDGGRAGDLFAGAFEQGPGAAADTDGAGTAGVTGAGASATFARLRPFLVVALILFLATAVTLLLLQSAGVVNLPFLGGTGGGGAAGAGRHLLPV